MAKYVTTYPVTRDQFVQRLYIYMREVSAQPSAIVGFLERELLSFGIRLGEAMIAPELEPLE